MNEWRKIDGHLKQDLVLQELSKRYREAIEKRDRCNSDLSAWQRGMDEDHHFPKVKDYTKEMLISERMLAFGLVTALEDNAKARERASSCTSDVSKWTDEMLSWGDHDGWRGGVGYLVELVKAAKQKILQIANVDIPIARQEIARLAAQINEQEEEIEKIIYLV
jgi:hypothetical protein